MLSIHRRRREGKEKRGRERRREGGKGEEREGKEKRGRERRREGGGEEGVGFQTWGSVVPRRSATLDGGGS